MHGATHSWHGHNPQGQTPPAQPLPPNAGPTSQTQTGPTAPPQPPQGRGGPGAPLPLNFSNQTLRQIVHTSVGGDRIRVIFSNVFGTAPLAIGAASVGLREKEAAIFPKSDRMLAFGGSPSTVVPAGAVVFSDPVNLNVSPQADLAIDLYLPGDTASPSPVATHVGALQTNFVSPTGNHVAAHPTDDSVNTTRSSGWRAQIDPVKSSAAIISPNPNDVARPA